jgi:hypothetical protein
MLVMLVAVLAVAIGVELIGSWNATRCAPGEACLPSVELYVGFAFLGLALGLFFYSALLVQRQSRKLKDRAAVQPK